MSEQAIKFDCKKRGVFSLSFEDYRRERAVNKGLLDKFSVCPADAMEEILRPSERVTEPMIFGLLAHACVSSPETFDSFYYLHPEKYPSKEESKPWNWNANYCKDWRKEHRDKPVISEETLDEIHSVVSALKADGLAKELLEQPGKFERSIFGFDDETSLPIKGRTDWLPVSDFVSDFKFTADAETSAFSKTLTNLRLHVQAAMYLDISGRSTFYFIAIERGERPRVNVRKCSQRLIDTGRAIYQQQLEELQECLERNHWPGLSGGTGKIEEIDIPEWEFNRVWGTKPITGMTKGVLA